MTQRRFILLLGAYLFTTAVMAWLAFMLGHGRGVGAADLPPAPARSPSAVVDVSENIWSCDQFRGFPGLRANHRERVCGAGGVAVPARHARPNGALQRAMVMTIAGDGPLTQARFVVPGPATATDPGVVFDAPGEPGGLLAGIGGHAPGGGRVPGQPFVLSGGPFQNGEFPPPEVTPIPGPGGLALMATALAGFAGAVRRRARS